MPNRRYGMNNFASGGLDLSDVMNLQFRLESQRQQDIKRMQEKEQERADLGALRGTSTFMDSLKSLTGKPKNYEAAYQLGKSNPIIQEMFQKAGILYDQFDPSIQLEDPEEKAQRMMRDRSLARRADFEAGRQIVPKEGGFSDNGLLEGESLEKAEARSKSDIEWEMDQQPSGFTDEEGNPISRGDYKMMKMAELKMKIERTQEESKPVFGWDKTGRPSETSMKLGEAQELGLPFMDVKEQAKQRKAASQYDAKALFIGGVLNEIPSELKLNMDKAFGRAFTQMQDYVNIATGSQGRLGYITDMIDEYEGFGSPARRERLMKEKQKAYALVYKYPKDLAEKDMNIARKRKEALDYLNNSPIASIITKNEETGEEELVEVPSPYLFFVRHWEETPKARQKSMMEDPKMESWYHKVFVAPWKKSALMSRGEE